MRQPVGSSGGRSGSRRFRRIARALDWRIASGIVVTLAYLTFGAYQIAEAGGWERLAAEPFDALGNFLEGAFAPLAFLWLVIGYFLQHRALRENNLHIALQYRQMRRSARHVETQAKALAANETHARQNAFFDLVKLVNAQLAATAGMLHLANRRPGSDDDREAEELRCLWTRVAEGDTGVFSRRLLDQCYTSTGRRRDASRILLGTPARRQYAQTFVRTFEDLLEEARAAGVKPLVTNALLEGTAHGYLYRTILECQRERDGLALVDIRSNSVVSAIRAES